MLLGYLSYICLPIGKGLLRRFPFFSFLCHSVPHYSSHLSYVVILFILSSTALSEIPPWLASIHHSKQVNIYIYTCTTNHLLRMYHIDSTFFFIAQWPKELISLTLTSLQIICILDSIDLNNNHKINNHKIAYVHKNYWIPYRLLFWVRSKGK